MRTDFRLGRGQRPPLWFWRTSAGDEIDLLVELAPERFITVECKAAAQVDLSAVKSNRVLREEYGPDAVAKALVVCRTDRTYPLAADTEAVPLTGPGGLLGRTEFADGGGKAEFGPVGLGPGG